MAIDEKDALLEKYDIYYINPASDKRGFMLARNAQGLQAWRRDDERGLPDSFAPGDISYANLSPDIQKVISHRYMYGGLGAIEFEAEDDADFQILRCLRTENIDTRCKGKTYPGPKQVAIATITPPAPTLANKDFEATGSWAGGVRSSAHPHGGTYSRLLLDEDAYQDAVTWDNSWRKHFFRKGVWVYTTAASNGRLSINDGVGTTYSSYHTGAAGWQLLSVGRQLSATATRLRVQLHADLTGADAVDAYFDDLTQGSPAVGSVPVWCEYNGKLLMATGNILSKLNATGDGFTMLGSFPAVATSLCPFSNGYLFIAIGRTTASKLAANINATATSMTVTTGEGANFPVGELYLRIESEIVKRTVVSADTFTIVRAQWGTTAVAHTAGMEVSDVYKYWYMNDQELFTESTLTNGEADKLCEVDSTKLYQVKLPNKVRQATDPLNTGSWGSEVLVGSLTYTINDIKNYLGLLYCMKQNGIYYLDTSDIVRHPFQSLETITHANAGKNSDVFLNKLYFRMGNQQEWEIDGTSITEITPALSAQGISQYAYPCVARAHDESWLYTIINRGASSLGVLAGRWQTIAGATRWIWHDIAKVTALATCVSALVSSVEGRPFLYLASDNAFRKLYLPATNDATADSGYRFATAGSLWTPRYTSLLFAFDKRWLELFARTSNLTATNYIDVFYSTDDGDVFTEAAFDRLDTSPEKTLTFPSGIESKMVNLRFDFVGDSETVPPALKYLNIKALTLVPSVVRFNHTVKCGDNLSLKRDLRGKTTQAEIITFLNTLRDKICTLGDPWGTEHTVRVRVTGEVEVYDDDTKKPELQVSIEAVKL